MSGFSFPPPPPPPPKAAQPQTEFSLDSSNRSRGRGRSSTNRGRGHHRGQNLQYNGSNYTPRQQNGSSTSFAGDQPNGRNLHTNQLTAPSQALPAGAYVNPNFIPTQPYTNRATPPSANTSWDNGLNNHHGTPQRTIAGHKRKLEALRGPILKTKEASPTVPSVPSFGAPILPPPNPLSSNKPAPVPSQSKSKSKSTTNLLGLTPSSWDVQYSSSDSDDNNDNEVDEEAMHAELGDKLTFEHNGIVLSLNSQADLAAWKKERQKNWPTTARMAERDVQRRIVGEERKRLLAEAEVLRYTTRKRDAKGKSENLEQPSNSTGPPKKTLEESPNPRLPKSKLQMAKREVAEQQRRLEELRRGLSQSEAKNRRLQSSMQLHGVSTETKKESEKGEEPRDLSFSADLPADLREQEVENAEEDSSDPSTDTSDSLSETDSDDGPPEEVVAKPAIPISASARTQTCRYFAASGYCRDGDTCRFKHERPEGITHDVDTAGSQPANVRRDNSKPQSRSYEVATKRQSLYQRLMEQQEEQEDRLALKVIKYLGQAGFFKQAGDAVDS